MKPTARTKCYVTISENDTIRFSHQNIQHEDFSHRKEKILHVTSSKFKKCFFKNLKIKKACFGAGLEKSIYEECSFDGSKIDATSPGMARFIKCTFRDVILSNFFPQDLEFIDCIFSGKIKKAVFMGRNIADGYNFKNEFRGNDFSNALLEDASFRAGIDLAQQKLPAGNDYFILPNAEVNIKKIKNIVTSWANSDLRTNLLVTLKTLQIESNEQNELFLNLNDFADSKEIIDVLKSLLKKFSFD